MTAIITICKFTGKQSQHNTTTGSESSVIVTTGNHPDNVCPGTEPACSQTSTPSISGGHHSGPAGCSFAGGFQGSGESSSAVNAMGTNEVEG